MKYLAILFIVSVPMSLLFTGCARNKFDPYAESAALASGVVGQASRGGADAELADAKNFVDVGRPKLSPSFLKPSTSEYKVGSGDRLNIEIVEVEKTERKVVVMPDGMLYYDAAPGVHASGKTLTELEELLADALRVHYDFPVVSATLAESRSRTYSVLGSVKKPGLYPLDRPTTLLEAVSEVGGAATAGGGGGSKGAAQTTATEIADVENAVVIRGNRVIPVDVGALIKSGDMSQNIYMEPNDVLYVPSVGSSRVFVLGAVFEPGSLPYSGRSTVVTTLAQARGFTKKAYRQGCLIIRDAVSNPKVAPVNVAAIITGRQPDIRLAKGDILWVPDRPWRLLTEYAGVAVDAVVSTIASKEGLDWGARKFGSSVEETSVAGESGLAFDATSEATAAPPEVEIQPEADADFNSDDGQFNNF